MIRDPKRITRTELYRQVWETPMQQLAKEYGLSDVGLAKICRKHNIPRPTRGYWRRKSTGRKVDKVPLPRQSSDPVIKICPNPSSHLASGVNSIISQLGPAEKKYPPIVVPKSLRNPHPLVSQASEILELCQPDDVGILQPPGKGCLDIRVSRNSLRRALRIMDALIKGILDRGFGIEQRDDAVVVKILEEDLGIGINEELERKKKHPDSHGLAGYYQFGHSRFDYVRVPSGKLCLTILGTGYFWRENLRRNWRDTDNRSLEDSLDSFMQGLIKMAAQKKEYRRREEEEELQRQEMARKREIERQRLAELKQRIKKEKARVAKLVGDAENYHKSIRIREFIRAVDEERYKGNTLYVSDEDFNDWAKWAADQADRLDPLKESPPSILDELVEDIE